MNLFWSTMDRSIARPSESKRPRTFASFGLQKMPAKAPLFMPDSRRRAAQSPRLLAEIYRGADLVCGYRVRRQDTLVKRLTSRVANAVRSRFTKDGVRDTGCTLKAMRLECVSALVPFKGMHRFIPALIKAAGYRLVEIPVAHRPRRFGQSKYGLGNRALRATIDMFGVRWLLSRRLHYKMREGDRQ